MPVILKQCQALLIVTSSLCHWQHSRGAETTSQAAALDMPRHLPSHAELRPQCVRFNTCRIPCSAWYATFWTSAYLPPSTRKDYANYVNIQSKSHQKLPVMAEYLRFTFIHNTCDVSRVSDIPHGVTGHIPWSTWHCRIMPETFTCSVVNVSSYTADAVSSLTSTPLLHLVT